MKTLIIYQSLHHENTKKLCVRLAGKFGVDIVNISNKQPEWDKYDTIGFASGISFGKFYDKVTEAVDNVPKGKSVFFLYTCGNNSKDFSSELKDKAEERGCKVLGAYGCRGFDTFGPFKLIGGINKNCPNEDELRAVEEFYAGLM